MMRIQITIDGQVYPIARDVATAHPQAIHTAMGTKSESELQYCLDQMYVGNWYEPNGTHRGPDSNGLEMFSDEFDRKFILAAIENDREGLIDGIKQIYNCREVSIDDAGDIWIEGPQRGHWLNADDLARVENALRAGDI